MNPQPLRGLTPEAAQLYRDYAEAYMEMLAVGAEEPDDSGLDAELAAEIRDTLNREWKRKVRRIYRRNHPPRA